MKNEATKYSSFFQYNFRLSKINQCALEWTVKSRVNQSNI